MQKTNHENENALVQINFKFFDAYRYHLCFKHRWLITTAYTLVAPVSTQRWESSLNICLTSNCPSLLYSLAHQLRVSNIEMSAPL